jgi:hypothetical protein
MLIVFWARFFTILTRFHHHQHHLDASKRHQNDDSDEEDDNEDNEEDEEGEEGENDDSDDDGARDASESARLEPGIFFFHFLFSKLTNFYIDTCHVSTATAATAVSTTYTEFITVFANVFLGMQLALSSYLQVCFSITNDDHLLDVRTT